MNFSDNLIKLRKGKGWSQEDLAEKLGISRQAISKWEVGTSKPDIDNIIKISKLFEVSIDELVNNEIVRTEAISINVKKKSKKDILLVWLRRILIVLIIIYFINVIYKFAMLFTITQAELKYKELDNYHYVVTSYSDDGMIEKEECWYKDGVSKTINVNINNQEKSQRKRVTCVDFNLNQGYIELDNKDKIIINMNEYKISNNSNDGKNQFYSKFPVAIKNKSLWQITVSALFDNDIDFDWEDDNILFRFNKSFINLEKGTVKPLSYYYKDNNTEKYITTYLSIEINCIDELKI